MVVQRNNSGEVDTYMNEQEVDVEGVVPHLRTRDLQRGGQYEGG